MWYALTLTQNKSRLSDYRDEGPELRMWSMCFTAYIYEKDGGFFRFSLVF